MKINDNLFKYYKSKLESFATELTKNTAIPINLWSICNYFNIEIISDTKLNNRAILVSKEGRAVINISSNYYNKINSPFIRHIISHEIGHYLLNFELKASITKNEYWVFEELCDFFSRSLLMPKDRVLSDMHRLKRKDLHQLLNFINYFSKKYNVTWISSVSRLKDYFEDLLFINFKQNLKTHKFIVNKSLLVDKKYLNSQFPLDKSIIFKFIAINPNSILLTYNQYEFLILQKKFPIIFNKYNKEVLLIFRNNNISVMAINYAQQSH